VLLQDILLILKESALPPVATALLLEVNHVTLVVHMQLVALTVKFKLDILAVGNHPLASQMLLHQLSLQLLPQFPLHLQPHPLLLPQQQLLLWLSSAQQASTPTMSLSL
jgi:hypothetical protein